jgi:hypothetical protein
MLVALLLTAYRDERKRPTSLRPVACQLRNCLPCRKPRSKRLPPVIHEIFHSSLHYQHGLAGVDKDPDLSQVHWVSRASLAFRTRMIFKENLALPSSNSYR